MSQHTMWMFVVAASLAASCGDDEGASPGREGYLLGTAQGSIWAGIQRELDLAPFDAQTDNGVWIASGAVASLDETQLVALESIYDDGYPIVLVTPTQADIDGIAARLGRVTFPLEAQDTTIELFGFDRVEGSTETSSWHRSGGETPAQLAHMADKAVAWYREAAVSLAPRPRAASFWLASFKADSDSHVWPTEESWPSHTFKATNSTGIYYELLAFVYPITDTLNQRYVYSFALHLNMESQSDDDVINTVIVTGDSVSTSYDDGHKSCVVQAPAVAGESPRTCDEGDTCAAPSITTDQIQPDSTLASGSVTTGWEVTVGASIGMGVEGPTVGINGSASINGSYTVDVPGVQVTNRADLKTGHLHWELDYGAGPDGGGVANADTSMVFGGVYFIDYADKQNEWTSGASGKCGWTFASDVSAKTPGDFWSYQIQIGDPEGRGSSGMGAVQSYAWVTQHPLDDAQAKAALK